MKILILSTYGKYDFSLEKAMQHFPNGAPDRIIAKALDISLEEVQALYASILEKIRAFTN
jgi:hypothetical protein